MQSLTYADLDVLSTRHGRGHRAAHMPLLGFMTGVALALSLWSLIGFAGWLVLGGAF
jgi:hypothetical protein